MAPERRNGSFIFVHGDRECFEDTEINIRLKLRWMALTVNFIFVFHEDEGVKVDIAVEMDVWSGRSGAVGCRIQACKSSRCTHSMRQYHLYFSIKGCLKKN